MRRWLWNGVAGVSAAACLLSALLWVISYRVKIEVYVPFQNAGVWLFVHSGGSEISGSMSHVEGYFRVYTNVNLVSGFTPTSVFLPERMDRLAISGFVFRAIWIPLSFSTIVFAVLPAVWLFSFIRNRHKRLPNHCRECGYDLTGTLAAGRGECPECGAGVNVSDVSCDANRSSLAIENDMADTRPITYRYRYLLLGCWLILLALGLVWLFAPAPWFPLRARKFLRLLLYHYEQTDGGYSGIILDGLYPLAGYPGYYGWWASPDYYTPIALGYLSILFLVLCGFVFSIARGWRDAPTLIQCRPRLGMIFATGLMAGFLTVATLTLMVDVLAWGAQIHWAQVFLITLKEYYVVTKGFSQLYVGWIVPAAWLVSGVLWTLLVAVILRQRERFWQYERVTRTLTIFATCLLALSIGEIWICQPGRSVYGHEGAYTAILLAVSVMLWAFGCRIILLFLFPKYEFQRLGHYCLECGYDLTGTLAAGRSECPECGAGIHGDVVTAAP